MCVCVYSRSGRAKRKSSRLGTTVGLEKVKTKQKGKIYKKKRDEE